MQARALLQKKRGFSDTGQAKRSQNKRRNIAACDDKSVEKDCSVTPATAVPREMFDDMVKRVPEINSTVLGQLNGRPLRVATMCSGTESPILALEMMDAACRTQHSRPLLIEHVFSCEIEPFKQSYIERNFAPPILFRDVRELGEDTAATAYGRRVAVPGSVDVLVAGTSCVDYSNLNNEKKEIDSAGESGQTFYGMLRWVKRHQPTIVILENVYGAPWKRMVDIFRNEVGYVADFLRLDSRDYYVPQTRQRGYLLAVRGSEANLGDWRDIVKGKLRAPYASTIRDFMLPSDSDRVIAVRRRLQEERPKDRISADWTRCESRHGRCRSEERLGTRRPFTHWSHGAPTCMPSWAWNEWASNQVERIRDAIDIQTKRIACRGTDATYRTLVWNVSQNIDRGIMGQPGCCMCLTPSGNFYVPDRGGPLIGEEKLLLQAIPADRLIITGETEKELGDLAGNAMTATVVGAVMLAALIVVPLDTPPLDTPPLDTPPLDTVPRPTLPREVVCDQSTCSYSTKVVTPATKQPATLLQDAENCCRLSMTERYHEVSTGLVQCLDCGLFAAKSDTVPIRPYEPHRYTSVPDRPPQSVQEFETALMSVLPARFHCDFADGNPSPDHVAGTWDFVALRRHRSLWCAEYTTTAGVVMRLRLHKTRPVWEVSTTRGLQAVIELDPTGNTLCGGEWKAAACTRSATCRVTEGGTAVPTWESEIGLEDHADIVRWSVLSLSCDDSPEINGQYTLITGCGGPSGTLYRNESDRALFIVCVGDPCAQWQEDRFVVTRDPGRHDTRRPLMVFSKTWRPSASKEGGALVAVTREVEAHVPPVDADTRQVILRPVELSEGIVELSSPVVPAIGCDKSVAMVTAGAYGGGLFSLSQTLARYPAPSSSRLGKMLETVKWLTCKLTPPAVTTRWQSHLCNDGGCNDGGCNDGGCNDGGCDKCCPVAPTIRWRSAVGKNGKTEFKPLEAHLEAAMYERAVKERPAIFTANVSGSEVSTCKLTIGVNVDGLCHRAAGALPRRGDAKSTVEWRLVKHDDSDTTQPSSLCLSNNRETQPSEQPAHFEDDVPLRPEQLRSLAWMKAREADEPSWVEREIVEEVLTQPAWRAEACAQRPVTVRGGIVADQVGYGKTATALALVTDTLREKVTPAEGTDLYTSNATLVVVPPTLLGQWPEEIEKFTGKGRLSVVVLRTVGDMNRHSVEDICSADVVLVSFSVLQTAGYLSSLAAAGDCQDLASVKDHRYFEQMYADCVTVVRSGSARPVVTEDEPELRLGGKRSEYNDGSTTTTDDTTPDDTTLRPAKRACKLAAWVLEMFHFKRLIVDEFHYLFEDTDRHRALTVVCAGISAERRWALSGTTPHTTFAHVDHLARLLGVHLGVDVDYHDWLLQSERFTRLLSEHTTVWHTNRMQHAQEFLDLLVRQNIAEIDEIPLEDHVVEVRLDPIARVLYAELEAHLRALDVTGEGVMTVRSSAKGDREERIASAIRGSSTPREALLKCCTLGGESCDAVLLSRQQQLDECVKEFRTVFRHTHRAYTALLRADPEWQGHNGVGDVEDRLGIYLSDAARRRSVSAGGDDEVDSLISKIIAEETEAGKAEDAKAGIAKAGIAKAGIAKAGIAKAGIAKAGIAKAGQENFRDAKWELRENVDKLRRLGKEMTGRYRSLRYFRRISEYATSGADSPPNCDSCAHGAAVSVVTTCGHMCCAGCLPDQVTGCGTRGCGAPGCGTTLQSHHIVPLSRFCAGDANDTETHQTKLSALIDRLQQIEAAGEHALVFVQFDDLRAAVSSALSKSDLRVVSLGGTVNQQIKTIRCMQSDNAPTALLLEAGAECAAGINLTTANHVLFLHPLDAASPERIAAFETQAIGRIRRYGQKKTCHVWRYLAADTVDTQ